MEDLEYNMDTIDAAEDITLSTTDEIISPVLSPVSAQTQQTTITPAIFFGTIQGCVTIIWNYHLKTKKHRDHITLNEFYYKAIDIIDDIIEQYQGIYGVIDDVFTNTIDSNEKTEIEYLQELKTFIEMNKSILGEHSEIMSSIDNLLSLIDKTLYKLTAFNENKVKSFESFCQSLCYFT